MEVPSPRPANPGRGILLVEDDESAAAWVQACLEKTGLRPDSITWTRTLTQACAALVHEPACVLLDLALPDANGLAALLTVVEASPDTPVIVLTGRHDPSGVDALAIGAQDYLVKTGITADLLARAIRYAVERKRAQRISQQLRDVRQSSAEKARLERGLLPTPLLRTGAVECATHYHPGGNHAVLGGDFFDVVESRAGLVRAIIGDVMGHGPDEAALGVHLRVAWRTLVLAGTPDDQVLPTLATLLEAESGGHFGFVTACDVTMDVDAASITMRVAGHPAPLHCSPGTTVYLDVAVGPPLGVETPDQMSAQAKWPETRAAFPAGSSLVLYTDGLLDSYMKLVGDRDMGIGELVDAVTAGSAAGSAGQPLIQALVSRAPNQSIDDTAIVVITSRATPGG